MEFDILAAVKEGLGLEGKAAAWAPDPSKTEDGPTSRKVHGAYQLIEATSGTKHGGPVEMMMTPESRSIEMRAGCMSGVVRLEQRVGLPVSIDIDPGNISECGMKGAMCFAALIMAARSLSTEWDKEGYDGNWRRE